MGPLGLTPLCPWLSLSSRGCSTVCPWAHPSGPLKLLLEDANSCTGLSNSWKGGQWSGPSCGSWWAEAVISRGHQINTAAPAQRDGRRLAGMPRGMQRGFPLQHRPSVCLLSREAFGHKHYFHLRLCC